MRRLTSLMILASIALAGCNSVSRQQRIEGKIKSAIHYGRHAEEIEQLVQQADDPSQAAYVAAYEVLHLQGPPTQLRRNWAYYRTTPPSSTPSFEIYEVVNRYKVSVLRILVPHRVSLNQLQEHRPLVFWSDWGNPPMTPELLTFLLENGYNPNEDGDSPSALGNCARPGQSFLRYDHKYEMIKALLKHGANPNVTSLV